MYKVSSSRFKTSNLFSSFGSVGDNVISESDEEDSSSSNGLGVVVVVFDFDFWKIIFINILDLFIVKFDEKI